MDYICKASCKLFKLHNLYYTIQCLVAIIYNSVYDGLTEKRLIQNAMRKLSVFNFISLDGCFEGALSGDIGWHSHDTESSGYAADMLAKNNTLLFGRVTYDMMAGYWSSEEAKRNDPEVADGMNRAEKIVFSRGMQSAAWSNTTVLNEDIVDQVRRMKRSEGNDMTILGSGSIVTQFARQDLVDEYQIMIDPVVVGNGRKIFEGIEKTIRLQLTGTKVFRNGSVILSYRRAECGMGSEEV